jgi:hypothetical protein
MPEVLSHFEGFEHSTSFKVGRCITAPARGLRDMMKKKQ